MPGLETTLSPGQPRSTDDTAQQYCSSHLTFQFPFHAVPHYFHAISMIFSGICWYVIFAWPGGCPTLLRGQKDVQLSHAVKIIVMVSSILIVMVIVLGMVWFVCRLSSFVTASSRSLLNIYICHFLDHSPILRLHLSYSLSSLKGAIPGILYGSFIGLIKRNTRSLDYSSFCLCHHLNTV